MNAVDELAIHRLLADVLDAVARGDAAAWGACWTEDGVWVIPGHGELVGAEAVARFAELRAAYAMCLQSLLSGRVDFEENGDGDTATGRWYFRELQRTADGAGSELYGCYDDAYRRTEAGWRFARRRFWVLYRGPVGLDGTAYRPPPPRA
jgi:ketosteroid isomerase-like protein